MTQKYRKAGPQRRFMPADGIRDEYPRPRPRPARPHARRTGRRPHSPPALTASLCRPWSEAAAGRSAASAPRLENPRPTGGAPASRFPAPAPPPPRSGPPPPPGPAAPHSACRGRAGEPGSRGAQQPSGEGPRGRCARVCAPPSQPLGRAQARQGPEVGIQGPHGCCPARVCVSVYVGAHAGWVYVRVCEREGAGACAPPNGVRLPGWSGVLVFVQCACVQARSPAHAGGRVGGSLCVCGGVDAEGAPATPGRSSRRLPG